ncbi:hypothetical protein WA026_017316, partial [Henosepilachna vigintioctopunctata]
RCIQLETLVLLMIFGSAYMGMLCGSLATALPGLLATRRVIDRAAEGPKMVADYHKCGSLYGPPHLCRLDL